VLVKYLRESFGIAREKGRTAIAGISVGAHGAVLAAASYPDLFGAAGGLSGFYDNLAMTENKLLAAVYGPYKKFEKRWEDDNIVSLAASLRETPVFIAHGMKDREYAFEQSRMLAIRLKQMEKKSPGKYRFEYVEKNYKMHNWDFWRQMVGPMMAYLDATLQK
jgi:S-formylglutathione hydrolase FrmB